jgi:hypothetical protein
VKNRFQAFVLKFNYLYRYGEEDNARGTEEDAEDAAKRTAAAAAARRGCTN